MLKIRMRKYICLLMGFSILFSCGTDKLSEIKANENWPAYLGSKGSSQYSSLKQINKSNVSRLTPVWQFRTGGHSVNGKSQIQCNPLIIDGVLYGTSPDLKAFALDAASGEELWVYDPHKDFKFGNSVNRGLVFWESETESRLFYSAGSFLLALNAKTGKLVHGFGQNGKVSLKEGLGDWAQDYYVGSSTPGVIFKDKLIVGTRVSESTDAAPGYIRAFNVVSGDVEWIFHTIPKPGEFGYDTWPKDAYKNRGGANSWAGMTLDESTGVVYIPTGSAAFDFWGGHRLGENLFANSLLALNASTGKRIWHYQTIRHDIWDRDLPAPPNLVQINRGDSSIAAVAQITKSGRVFVFDRSDGTPLYPIEEIEAPASKLMGEDAWPSQPLPTSPPPFARQLFTDEEVTNISPEATAYVQEKIKHLNYGAYFMPPSIEGTVILPGFDGGAEWGGAAYDEGSGLLYVNANEMPWILTMVPTNSGKRSLGNVAYLTNCAMCHGPEKGGDETGAYPSLLALDKRLARAEVSEMIKNGKGRMPAFKQLSSEVREQIIDYLFSTEGPEDFQNPEKTADVNVLPYTTTGYNRFFDQEGYPAIKPPWGTLNAINLNKGEIAWSVPLGEFAELTEKGIPQTGTENYGGPVVTAGGLVFIAASKDEYFRAFDKDSGEELWKYKLPVGGYATPSVYSVAGKQYVVIAAGGGKMGTPSGDYYIAFALN
ncbi:MAG: PQQ-binding-like beta-propeller repeat protein [Cytophagales bacterium]|uniref:outer membrane protein assembly factor BamB family protein n=1 Tax=Cyclobacterium marinum TaxID=104 RepID=UPI0030DAC26F|nr:PQQ-binding-like beta-propeller repeat protein [Cytophagales bacterium]